MRFTFLLLQQSAMYLMLSPGWLHSPFSLSIYFLFSIMLHPFPACGCSGPLFPLCKLSAAWSDMFQPYPWLSQSVLDYLEPKIWNPRVKISFLFAKEGGRLWRHHTCLRAGWGSNWKLNKSPSLLHKAPSPSQFYRPSVSQNFSLKRHRTCDNRLILFELKGKPLAPEKQF